MGILKEIFKKNASPKVLDYFLSHPDESFFRYNIEKGVGISNDAADRSLSQLIHLKIINEKKVGKKKIYSLEKENEYVKKLSIFYHWQGQN